MEAELGTTGIPSAPASPAVPPGDIDAFVRYRLGLLAARLTRQRDQPIDRATMEELQFLRALSSLAQQGQLQPAAKPRARMVVPALFLATAITVTALIFIRLPSIGVDADVLCSALAFRTGALVQLTGLSRLRMLQAGEFEPLSLEDPASGKAFAISPPMELRPDSTGGALTLGSITIPAGALVSLAASGDSATWRLSIEHDEALIGATVSGPVHVAAGGTVAETIAFGRGAVVELRAAASTPRRIDVHITPEQAESLLAGRLIPVTQIDFVTAVDDAPGTHGVLRGVTSSVLEGSVFNVSLAGRESKLRHRDTLDLNVLNATVRELRLEPAGVRVSLSGDASDVRLGRMDRLQTIRPSYLEWLAEHHALRTAWAGAAWLFALFLGGMKWWHEFAH